MDKVYKLDKNKSAFQQCYAIITMLYGSRSFTKEELRHLVSLILELLPDQERVLLRKLTDSYDFNYVPMVNRFMIPYMKELHICIREQKMVYINYTTLKGEQKRYSIAPVSIAYNEAIDYSDGQYV